MEMPTRQQRFTDTRSSNRSSKNGTQSRHGSSRDIDNDGEQLLLHQTVMTSKKQQVELQQERVRRSRGLLRFRPTISNVNTTPLLLLSLSL